MRLSAIAWRSLAARPLRTALTVAGVALGVAIVAATLIANQAADEAVERAAQELLGRAEIRVRAFRDDGFTPRTVQALRSLPGVEAGAPVSERRLVVSTEPGPNEQVFSLLVIGIEPQAEPAVRDPNLVAGVYLSADSPTDALVPASWAADRGLGLGDRLLMSGRRPGLPPLRIVGLLDDVGLGAVAQRAVVLVSRDALDAAFEIPAPVRYVDLVVAAGSAVEVQAAIDATLSEPFVIETAVDAAERLGRAQVGFAGIAFVIGLVALVVGAFLVGTTMAMTVGERTREIGLLRAAGATSRQILGLYLRHGIALGLAGAGLGMLLGIGGAAAMIAFLSSTRAVLIGGLPISPWSLALASGLGLAVTIAAAAVPAVRAAGVTSLEALRPSRHPGRGLWEPLRWLVALELFVVVAGVLLYPLDRGDGPILSLAAALAILVGGVVAAAFALAPLGRLVGRPFEWFFGAEAMLGRINLLRERARTGLTVGMLMIALAAVVALGAVAESARASADRWVGSILPGGHAVRLSLAVEIEQLRSAFDATTGLRVASPIVELPAVLREVGAQREVSLAGIDPSVFQDAGSLEIIDGPRSAAFNALRDGGAVLVPEAIALRDGLERGSAVTLAQPGGGEHIFIVAGVVAYTLPARSPDGALLIRRADAAERFGVTTAALWAMVPQPNIPPSAFAAAVRDTAAQLAGESLTAASLASDLGRSLDRLIGLFDVLALIVVVIGGLGIVNTLAVGVSERVREISILRAHGMTVAQVQAMVVSEAAIMGAVGGLLAIAVGLGVAWTMISMGAARDFGAGLVLPWPLLVAIVLMGTGVAALAGAYPARVAGNLPIIGQTKHFE